MQNALMKEVSADEANDRSRRNKVQPMPVAERLALGGNLSLIEAAAIEGISIRTVYEEISARRFPTTKIGRRRVVTSEDLRRRRDILAGKIEAL